jgi:hypothetical protein
MGNVEELNYNIMNYEPLTEEEYNSLQKQLAEIGNYLPDNLMGTFWNYCNRIRGERTPQPCGCRSAGGLWGNCVADLRAWVSKHQ